MRTGSLPSRDLALREVMRSRPTRRKFLTSSLACAGLGLAAGVAVGRWMFGRDESEVTAAAPLEPRLQWAMQAMRGPLASLLEEYTVFMFVVDTRCATNPWLWEGVDRVCSAAASGHVSKDVANRVLETLRRQMHPAQLDRHIPALRQITEGR